LAFKNFKVANTTKEEYLNKKTLVENLIKN